MKLFLFIIISFLSLSCAKLSYMTNQGIGHLKLEWNSIDNKDVLSDENVEEDVKNKIRLIQKYKTYYYKYFNKEETPIYNETTFLKDKAVTYLVIASPVDKIEAIIHDFPFIGKFPYKGFFDKEDADDFIKECEEKGLATFIRPVYAYSTLDRTPFHDNILSSFFMYSDEKLASLIFHELTHTLFFIDDEISLNESLAEVISESMTTEYFKKNEEDLLKVKKSQLKNEKLSLLISQMSKELSKRYTKTNTPQIALDSFLNKQFIPKIKKLCLDEDIKHCWPLKKTWNNARFAAFGTYQKQQNLLQEIKIQNKLNTKEFLIYIQHMYKKYKNEDLEISFKKYLKQKALR